MDGYYIVLDSDGFKKCEGMLTANTGNSFTNDLSPPIDNFKANMEMAVVEMCTRSEELNFLTNQVISCDLIERYQFGAGKCQHLKYFYGIKTKSGPLAHKNAIETKYSFNLLQYYPLQRGVFDKIHIDIHPLYDYPRDPKNPKADLPNLFRPTHVILRLHVREMTKSKEAKNFFIR
jgi:hypothetical protein